MGVNESKKKSIAFRKSTKFHDGLRKSKTNIVGDSGGAEVLASKIIIRKRENTLDDLLYQRSLLSNTLNAARDSQSILIVNKKISRLNGKIQDILNENSKKLMSHQYGFVVAEEDEKASDPLTSTSRIDTRRLLSPLKAGEYINSYENTDKSNNKELNNKGKQGVNKKNSLANKKNYQHQNSKYKYFSLLREPFLENEDIINMSDSTREVYNTNKRYDKLTRLKNQLKMNKLRKMIDAKTFVEPDFSDNKPSILFVRKKDMRSNVYNPCLSYKPGYETLIKKSVRPVGFKKTKSQTLSENIIQMNDLKSNYIKSNSNINANNLNETNENTTDEGAEIELNKNNYDKSSIVSKMNINTQNEENKCQTNTCSLIKEKNKINHKNLNSFKIDNEYIIQEEKKFKNSPVKNINLSKILITQQQNIKTNTFHNAKRSLNKEDQENAMMKKLRDKFLEEKKKNFKKEADINLKTTKSINNINSNYNKLQKKCKKKSKSLNINNSISNNSLFERLSQSNSFNNFSDSEYTKQYNIDNKYNSKNFNSDTKNKTSQKLDILRKNKIDIINKRDITSTQSNLRPNSTNLVYDKKFFLSFKEKNKIKENLFREKLTKFRKIFGLAYKESKRLDVRFIFN